MIGLGVGIDYALFVVTRHRQHLHEGMSVADSAATANATAGQAVLFAGTTVVIAIVGLVIAGLPGGHGDGLRHRDRRARRHARGRDAAARLPRPRRHEDRQAGHPPAQGEGRRARDLRRQVGPPRRPQPVALRASAASSCSRRSRSRCAHCASAWPTTATSRRRPRSASPTTCSPRASVPGFNGPFQIAVDVSGAGDDPQPTLQRIGDASPTPTASRRSRPRSSTKPATPRSSRRNPDVVTAGRGDVEDAEAPARRRVARRGGRHRRRGARHRLDGVLRGRQRAHHASACRCSSERSCSCRSSCS